MWYDTEDWKKTSRITKCLNMVLIVVCWFLWVLVGARVVKDYAVIPATRIAESFAIGLGGMVTFSALVRFAVERDEITDLIHVVDAKFFCVPKDKLWWARSKKVYIVEGYILFGAMVLGFLVGGSQLIFMAYTVIISLSLSDVFLHHSHRKKINARLNILNFNRECCSMIQSSTVRRVTLCLGGCKVCTRDGTWRSPDSSSPLRTSSGLTCSTTSHVSSAFKQRQ